MAAILEGLRVVEGAAFVAAPLAGMTLAQMGADVIRFDRIQGGLDAKRWPVNREGESYFWAGLNKGKRSVAVDLGTPRGREIVTRLITAPGRDAGVFLTNLRIRGWMDYPELSRLRPDLIMVSVLGTRQGGPAVDYTVNPAVGFPHVTGPEGSTEPVAHALPAWDCICGQSAVVGLLAAERRRRMTGAGDLVEVALKDVAAAMLGNLGIIGEAMVDGVDRRKYGNALFGAFGHDFPCADDRRVMVIGLTHRQWRGLCEVTGTSPDMKLLGERLGLDLDEEGDRFRARKEIAAILAPWFAERRVADFAAVFDKAGITWSEFRSFRQALAEDPDLSEANPMFAMVDQPGLGRYLTPGSPLAFDAFARQPPRPAPRLGQHTEEVLGDVLGMTDGEIAALFDDGVVSGPTERPPAMTRPPRDAV
jgi:2-methylfumaryl-CoA isomerase